MINMNNCSNCRLATPNGPLRCVASTPGHEEIEKIKSSLSHGNCPDFKPLSPEGIYNEAIDDLIADIGQITQENDEYAAQLKGWLESHKV